MGGWEGVESGWKANALSCRVAPTTHLQLGGLDPPRLLSQVVHNSVHRGAKLLDLCASAGERVEGINV